jgi:hypothetical protein
MLPLPFLIYHTIYISFLALAFYRQLTLASLSPVSEYLPLPLSPGRHQTSIIGTPTINRPVAPQVPTRTP